MACSASTTQVVDLFSGRLSHTPLSCAHAACRNFAFNRFHCAQSTHEQVSAPCHIFKWVMYILCEKGHDRQGCYSLRSLLLRPLPPPSTSTDPCCFDSESKGTGLPRISYCVRSRCMHATYQRLQTQAVDCGCNNSRQCVRSQLHSCKGKQTFLLQRAS